MSVDVRELATILAALRFWQIRATRSSMERALKAAVEISVIATNNGDFDPLGAEEIVALCERINAARTTPSSRWREEGGPEPRFTIERFHNALRIMRSIDLCELQDKGLMAKANECDWKSEAKGDGMDDWQAWLNFRADPCRYFVRCGDEDAKKIFEIVESRQ